MGFVPIEETHDPRPTNKLFALRWKHEHLRFILLGAILSFAITVMFTSLLHRAAAKNVTLVDDGMTSVELTSTSNVLGFLEEQQIQVGPNDRISLLPTDPLKEGSQIVIDRAKSITIKADGKQQAAYTTEDSVGGVLKELRISLGGEDRISPSLDTPVTQGLNVAITRVRKEITETQHPIAFKVVKKQNEDLTAGKEKVVTTGKNGLVKFKTERVFENGKLVSQKLIEKTVAQPAIQQVVSVGTKKKPEVVTLAYKEPAGDAQVSADARTISLNGQSVKIKKMLTNVTLTAYSAGLASTGKTKGHPEYGVTASGAIVKEGRTIAVDPDVIPLGWWVYIEGIGFRRAEDTGSAIKGKKIDVFFESEKYANKFGRQSGFKVYVIGPVKPSSS
ncbi:hypothetical protein SD71_16420 [Cohnella kolymensis]|uniref:G5 domain-containing protein n=1 Tax=Cohnella kolymensis TaxID=1590652 RepID=A0ABR5A1Y2_9BACL|nr:3D domain-containing protein [Cohnella kolymensis]KIL34942.1 hypothetical protein SD71_16420 [Cohnella kolymensis]